MADVDPFSTATSLLGALRAGTIRAGELTELYIRRIERHDRALNAAVVRDFTRAREQAVAAEHARTRGEQLPLLGLPITSAQLVAGAVVLGGLLVSGRARARRAPATEVRPGQPCCVA